MQTASGCQQINGYTLAPNVDHIGDDISRASSVADAANKCNTDATCKGFNSDGWYKRSVSPTTAAANGYCFYTKSGCQQINGYTLNPNVDHSGDDISRASSVADAANKCNTDATCKGFNSDGWYKRSVSPTTAAANGYCFYTKSTNSGCQQINGYTLTPNVDHSGDDISRASSVADAANKCNTDATCKGFNSDGWYKRSVSPTTAAANGYCFYTKSTNTPPNS
ncbi:hypothetical protein TSOC_006482 [Tetrabaena socialis]|uniref:Apple domain-containing protein n=1 Tax=Tetrabaena socialis TaxID=47790 RepID=A0A2J8A3L1_9CHLO|nr:hypothetical protein TSOC_006482 [Tetrabaena socialis]|eukprot:PNH07093.1 hypothetical protein TSOC_006482 [Tetrabaena socialis]